MIDQDQLTGISRILLAANLRVLQGYRLADSELEHVAKLLTFMHPAPDTKWLDIGCGFGEPARLMQKLRPDLTFTLVNNNSFQLSQAPDWMPSFCCDMHELPFNDASFDGAMFLYSLCHADSFTTVLKEAARVVRPGGRLFVFDYVRAEDSDDELSRQHLAARFLPLSALRPIARIAGWNLADLVRPAGSDAVFRSVMGDQGLYNRIFSHLTPIIWWAERR